MPKTAVFLSEDSIDILGHILDNHERMLTERGAVMPPFALASAIRDVEAIRNSINDRVRES
jgi:hypothetical protein